MDAGEVKLYEFEGTLFCGCLEGLDEDRNVVVRCRSGNRPESSY